MIVYDGTFEIFDEKIQYLCPSHNSERFLKQSIAPGIKGNFLMLKVCGRNFSTILFIEIIEALKLNNFIV